MSIVGEQLELYEPSSCEKKRSEWGTFKDNLKAPIHNWFAFPTGFSYNAVNFAIRKYGITQNQTVYDPFMGSGTTNLTAKTMGISSFGVEAHPFVFNIAKVKMNTQIRLSEVLDRLQRIEALVISKQKRRPKKLSSYLETKLPELVLKCYEKNTLFNLLLIRDTINKIEMKRTIRDFFNVGLTSVLRQISTAATGWPYIAPNKPKLTSFDKDGLQCFCTQIHKMVGDVRTTRCMMGKLKSSHKIYNSDAKCTTQYFDDNSVDFVFTSPPYLNNFDYADRTRLELYFFGQAKTWGDITEKIRTRLMTSATTQILRTDSRYVLSADLKHDSPDTYDFIHRAVKDLGGLRLTKGGKKSYDLMVSGYFNDIYLILKDVFRVLKKGTHALFILGDSAPYGVYVPTDELIGKIGVDIGFSSYHISVLRKRGGKWKKNPQRHSVALRESIVTLVKG